MPEDKRRYRTDIVYQLLPVVHSSHTFKPVSFSGLSLQLDHRFIFPLGDEKTPQTKNEPPADPDGATATAANFTFSIIIDRWWG